MRRCLSCLAAAGAGVEGACSDVAERVGAPLIAWGEDFDAFEQRGRLVFQQQDQLLDLPLPALIGAHQIVNAGTAVAAALAFKPVRLDERAIGAGLADVRWPARMQRLDAGSAPRPAAHRTASCGSTAATIPAGGPPSRRRWPTWRSERREPLHLIIGMMGQKEAARFLEPFRGLARRVVTVPIPGAHEAPFAPENLAQIAQQCGLDARTAEDVPSAAAASSQPRPRGRCGS